LQKFITQTDTHTDVTEYIISFRSIAGGR